jgi:hypothetical protein
MLSPAFVLALLSVFWLDNGTKGLSARVAGHSKLEHLMIFQCFDFVLLNNQLLRLGLY